MDLEKFILDAMAREGVSFEELERARVISTPSALLDFDYWCDVHENPVSWSADSYVIRGAADEVVPLGALDVLMSRARVELTSLPGRGHFLGAEGDVRLVVDWFRRVFEE
ncbi:hypothetical protein [uncultured Propionibacterium sp.]|uniref:hypothetical protein n=1 Tax=uncultured Propionibacterium sp. TaxID=218066 RepID=UPI00292FAA16|nr:hypothetical protein [uncultured Propionibacterium sp.]